MPTGNSPDKYVYCRAAYSHEPRYFLMPADANFYMPSFKPYKEAIKRMKSDDKLWRMKGAVVSLTWMNKKAVHAAGTLTQASCTATS